MKISKIMFRLVGIKAVRYTLNGTVMDVKWEPDSDNGWAAVGNCWLNLLRGLIFPVTYSQIVIEGWKRI